MTSETKKTSEISKLVSELSSEKSADDEKLYFAIEEKARQWQDQAKLFIYEINDFDDPKDPFSDPIRVKKEKMELADEMYDWLSGVIDSGQKERALNHLENKLQSLITQVEKLEDAYRITVLGYSYKVPEFKKKLRGLDLKTLDFKLDGPKAHYSVNATKKLWLELLVYERMTQLLNDGKEIILPEFTTVEGKVINKTMVPNNQAKYQPEMMDFVRYQLNPSKRQAEVAKLMPEQTPEQAEELRIASEAWQLREKIYTKARDVFLKNMTVPIQERSTVTLLSDFSMNLSEKWHEMSLAVELQTSRDDQVKLEIYPEAKALIAGMIADTLPSAFSDQPTRYFNKYHLNHKLKRDIEFQRGQLIKVSKDGHAELVEEVENNRYQGPPLIDLPDKVDEFEYYLPLIIFNQQIVLRIDLKDRETNAYHTLPNYTFVPLNYSEVPWLWATLDAQKAKAKGVKNLEEETEIEDIQETARSAWLEQLDDLMAVFPADGLSRSDLVTVLSLKEAASKATKDAKQVDRGVQQEFSVDSFFKQAALLKPLEKPVNLWKSPLPALTGLPEDKQQIELLVELLQQEDWLSLEKALLTPRGKDPAEGWLKPRFDLAKIRYRRQLELVKTMFNDIQHWREEDILLQEQIEQELLGDDDFGEEYSDGEFGEIETENDSDAKKRTILAYIRNILNP